MGIWAYDTYLPPPVYGSVPMCITIIDIIIKTNYTNDAYYKVPTCRLLSMEAGLVLFV
jgi:hypothetical protein